jgi:hypothetical protein
VEFSIRLHAKYSHLASCGSEVVNLLSCDPKLKGSNPASTGQAVDKRSQPCPQILG